MLAYVLIEAAVGKAQTVAAGIKELGSDDVKVRSVETVTGPYDIVAMLEFDDMDTMGMLVGQGIQQVDGVERTTTCLVIGID